MREKKMLSLFLLLFVSSVNCDDLFELFRRGDRCVALCETVPQISASNDHTKSCCQRGCRFFNLVDLSHGLLTINSVNGSKDACESSCQEAYFTLENQAACNSGCEVMAKQRITELSSILSALFVVDDSNWLSMSLDTPENDAMTDPGLRKELFPGWWDTEGFKLPQTFIKTVPKDTDTMGDYDGFPVYNSELSIQNLFAPRHSNFSKQYTPKKGNIPSWVIHLGFAVFMVVTNCLCICCKNRELIEESIVIADVSMAPEKETLMSKLIITMPDEIVPLHKTPPPKYSEIADINEITFKQ